MWDKGKKKHKRATKIDSLIGRHSMVKGDLTFNGGLHVDGTIKGNVTADDNDGSSLSLSEHSTVEGTIKVPYITLNGVVVGDVHSTEHVELQANARVTGDVYYNLLEMALGAQVNGRLVRQPHEPGALPAPKKAIERESSTPERPAGPTPLAQRDKP